MRPQGVHKGTLVICHNYRASKQKVLPWIRFLCGAGYEAVAFDFNGHGDSDRAHSWWGAVEDTVLDLETVLGQLGRLPSSNSSRVGLLGFSMGAMSVFGYLSLHADQNNIGAVIIDSGPPHPKVWYSLVDMSLSPHFRKLPGIRLVHHLVRYWQRFERTPQEVRHLPLVVLNLEVPFLFIHGLKDNICPPEESRWICDHLTRAPKEYWAVPEARHLTNLTLRKREYQQRVLRFLDRFLACLPPVGGVENHHEEAVVQDRKGGVL